MLNSKLSIELILEVLQSILNEEEYSFVIKKINNNCLFTGNALSQIVEYLITGEKSILKGINDIDLFESIKVENLKEEHKYEDYRGNVYSSIPNKDFFFLYPEYSGKVSLVKIHCYYSSLTEYFEKEYMSNWTNLYMTKDELYIGDEFNKFILTKELKVNLYLPNGYFILALDKMQNKIIKSNNRYKEADFIYYYNNDKQISVTKYSITNSTYGSKLIHNCKIHKKVHKLARNSYDSNYIEFINKCNKVTEGIKKKYLEYAFYLKHIIDFTNKTNKDIEDLYNRTVYEYVELVEKYYKEEDTVSLSLLFEKKWKEIWDIKYEINNICKEKGYPICEEDLILQFNFNNPPSEILKLKDRISSTIFLERNIVFNLLIIETPDLLEKLNE